MPSLQHVLSFNSLAVIYNCFVPGWKGHALMTERSECSVCCFQLQRLCPGASFQKRFDLRGQPLSVAVERKQNEGLFRAADQHFHVVCELFTVFLFSVNWINSNLNLPLETKHVFNNGILSLLSVIFNSPPNPVPYTCLQGTLCTYSHSPPNGCLSENGLN